MAVSYDMQRLIEISRTFVQEYMLKYDSSHDYSHIERVLALARHLEAAERQLPECTHDYDSDLITLAALLHDVGDRKYLKQGENGAIAVCDFLLANHADTQLAATVQDIVNHVSYTNEIKNPGAVGAMIARYPELAIVQDADRLDALGAVGIARCFTYNANVSRHGTLENAIEHFEHKLVGLESMMKTGTGRIMAIERTKRIRLFQQWWWEECNGR